jgi:hypothetical protein
MVCHETGEELDPVEQLMTLHRRGALMIDDKVLPKVMRIMIFMARCDAEFHSLERSEIEDVLARYMRFFGGEDADLERALGQVGRLAPTGEHMLSSLRSISRLPQRRELAGFILDSSGAIVHADGVVHERELDWGIEVGNALRRIAGRVPGAG